MAEPAAHAARRGRLVALLPEHVDALLVTSPANVRYLTGFSGSNGAVLVPQTGDPVFATDGRYVTQAASEVPDLRLVESRALPTALLEVAQAAGVRRLGVEAEHMTVAAFERLGAAASATTPVAISDVVAELRIVKDADEVELIREACRITDAALASLLGRLSPGATEREVADRLLATMRAEGADGTAFDSIVAGGPHSAIPHHQPTDRPLGAGDLLKLDFGAAFRGYCADMTRTVVMGPAADWQRDLHLLVHDLQQELREAVVVGADPRRLHERFADVVQAAGVPVAHGLGHGIGLDVHESPFLTAETNARPLAAGAVVTVEPGVYLPGRGGVRIEDVVVVTEGSSAPSLSRSPRDLIEV